MLRSLDMEEEKMKEGRGEVEMQPSISRVQGQEV